MKDEEKKEIFHIINQIEQRIKELPDYEETVIIHDRMNAMDEKLNKILERLS